MFDSLSPDDELSTVLLALVRQISSECLPGGTHQASHGGFDLADLVVVASGCVVGVHHHEFVALNFLEKVRQCERGLKIWIEIVVDDLSLRDLGPLLIGLLLEEPALGVRLAKCVQVLELAPRNKQVHLHAHL